MSHLKHFLGKVTLRRNGHSTKWTFRRYGIRRYGFRRSVVQPLFSHLCIYLFTLSIRITIWHFYVNLKYAAQLCHNISTCSGKIIMLSVIHSILIVQAVCTWIIYKILLVYIIRHWKIKQTKNTVNWEIFARVYFHENAKFHENKSIMKCQNHSVGYWYR